MGWAPIPRQYLPRSSAILSFEIILAASALLSGLIALLIGTLCVRYTKIFFGMLTLAFGMLFHSFLYKFYAITGGDRACASCGPLLLGMEWRGGKTAFLTGPFYYYTLVLFAVPGFGDVAYHPIAVRPASARDPGKRRQGCVCRRRDFSHAAFAHL